MRLARLNVDDADDNNNSDIPSCIWQYMKSRIWDCAVFSRTEFMPPH